MSELRQKLDKRISDFIKEKHYGEEKNKKLTLLHEAYEELEKDRATVRTIYANSRPDISKEKIEKMISGMNVNSLLKTKKEALKHNKLFVVDKEKKDLVLLDKKNKAVKINHKLEHEKRKRYYDQLEGISEKLVDFPVASIDDAIKTKDFTRQHFDLVIYPVKTIIPDELTKLFGNWKEITFKNYKGKKNCIQYFCSNELLTDKQCEALYLEQDIRSVFGYLLNGALLSGENFNRYIRWVDKNISEAEDTPKIDEIKYGELAVTTPTNIDGSREPILIQVGLRTIMKKYKLKNPVELIDVIAKKPDAYKIADFIHLSGMFKELNIYPQEAFEYICKYIAKNRNVKRLHKDIREAKRGSSALKNLVEFYHAECERRVKAKKNDPRIKLYSYPQLEKSKEYEEYLKQSGDIRMGSGDSFKRWFGNILKKFSK